MSSLEIAELIQDICNKYQFYSSILVLFIGIISNILTTLIFITLPIFRENRSAYYLAIESMASMGVLLAALPSDIVGDILGNNPIVLSRVWCKIQLMISYSCGLYSLFTICFLALDQYLSTHHRQNWRQLSTLKLAHRLTFCNITIALFHGILFLIFSEIGSSGCTIYQPILRIYFTFFYYPILSSIFPLIVNILFSLLAYRNVRRIIRRQMPLIRRRLDRQMTAIALARVICITILGMPFIIYRLIILLVDYDDEDYIKKEILNFLSVFTNLLLYTNYSINFYIFLIISPRFRHQVKHFFIKKVWRWLTRSCHSRLTVSTHNQIAPDISAIHVPAVESA